MSGLNLNYSAPEQVPNLFHDKLSQLLELARRKSPEHTRQSLTSTSIVREGRLMKALNFFLKREPTVRSGVLAKAIAQYCTANQSLLLPKEKLDAEKAIGELKNLQIQKHPKSKKPIGKQFDSYMALMKKVAPEGLTHKTQAIFFKQKED